MAAMYRSVVADSKVLIVLDDAHNAAQVRPLIPGGAGSALIVTSRNRLADLEGSRTMVLRRLTEKESLRLLGAIVGRPRVEAELPAARRIAQICGGLPLAIRIVGIRLLGQPHRAIADAAERLERPDRLLDELSVGDLAVRDCLDAGYAALTTAVRHGVGPALVFRTLGALDSATFSAATVSVPLNCSDIEAEDALDYLVDANLVDRDGPRRYRLHDTERAYARERAEIEFEAEHQVDLWPKLLAGTCAPSTPPRWN
jgi:hypothetical protein